MNAREKEPPSLFLLFMVKNRVDRNGRVIGKAMEYGRDNIDAYIRDMDKSNKRIKESRKRKLSNDNQAISREEFNRLWDIPLSGGKNKKYRDTFDRIKSYEGSLKYKIDNIVKGVCKILNIGPYKTQKWGYWYK